MSGLVGHSSVGSEITQDEYEGDGAHTIDGSTAYTVVTTTGSPTFTTTVTCSASLISSSSASVAGMLTAAVARGASLMVAASTTTGTALEYAQADSKCDATADDVQLNAAMTALS